MTSLLAFLFVLGVLIFVHELGHFVMARWHGIRVLTFSLGFGPKILKVNRGGTEYCVSAIPLGGYVKMAGEHAEDARSGAPDEFMSKTKWQRFQVLIMGPVMNLVLAVVVLAGVLYMGAEVPAYEQEPPVVGAVAEGSPAERVGIQPADRIVSVSGREVDTWERFFIAVSTRAGDEIPIVIERDGREQTLRVVPDPQTEFEVGDIGVLPDLHPQIRMVNSGEPAAEAGLQVNDVILAINGERIRDNSRLVEVINSHPGEPVTLGIRRGGDELDVEVTPRRSGDIGLIGVQLSPYEVRTVEPGFFQAIGMSVQRNVELTRLIFETLAGLVTAQTSPRQLMGPVGMAQLSGGAAEVGLGALFSLMSMISLNLGLLNLLPIPVLDGGHILIMAMEGVARRDFSIRVKERMLLAGFVVLMLLMVTVLYNDLARIGWMPGG